MRRRGQKSGQDCLKIGEHIYQPDSLSQEGIGKSKGRLTLSCIEFEVNGSISVCNPSLRLNISAIDLGNS